MEFTVSEGARAQIEAALQNQSDDQPVKEALRVEATTNGTSEFAYGLRLIPASEIEDDDVLVDQGSFKVVVAPGSTKNLDGATLDYEDRIIRSGFKFDNPNKPEIPSIGAGTRPDLKGRTAEKIQTLIDSELNPAVAAHGGNITLVGVKEDKAYLSFGGGCHGCGMVDVTLKQGVEARIRDLIPEISEVVDTTDHASGTDPFYA